jgi:hypothetical protein
VVLCKFEKICDMISQCYFAFVNQRVKEKGDKYAGRHCLFVRYPDLVFGYLAVKLMLNPLVKGLI